MGEKGEIPKGEIPRTSKYTDCKITPDVIVDGNFTFEIVEINRKSCPLNGYFHTFKVVEKGFLVN